jgi:hypothetical protein
MAAGASHVARLLRVFVASPGGVETERETVCAIVNELNGALTPHGWQVVALGWEQRGPTGGRAQADINADVRTCDIFLGILWNRWGRPTGEHKSGFEEEWTIALARHMSSGNPDLWLYFKRLPADAESVAATNEQLASVLRFRREVEDGDLAFHKTFESPDEFTSLVRGRLLTEVFERAGLTRSDLGAVAIDWAAAYEQEPVDLVSGGRTRLQLVDELEASRPAEAARLLVGLGHDVERAGFAPTADSLRERACAAWLAAGESEEALALFRRIMRAFVWELRADDGDMVLRRLQEQLPPELAVEVHAWRACLDAPIEPTHSAATLDEALRARHGFALDDDTLATWRAVRWRSLLEAGAPDQIIRDDAPLEPNRGGIHLELALLRAEALRASSDAQADDAWRELRLLAIDAAAEQPELAAWIATRAALDALTREDLRAAEIAYADAATRWTKVRGGAGNAAIAFFSAQTAARLRQDWSFSGWSWRAIAAQQRTGLRGLAARADELERQALYALEEASDARSLLRAATWCYLRGGFAHGVMRCRALLADTYAARDEEVSAVALHCEAGQWSAAEKLAAKAKAPRNVADRMAARFPTWATDARLGVLKHVGLHTSPLAAEELVRWALGLIARGEQRQFDNTPTHAAEALAMLAAATENRAVLESAVVTLNTLARDERYAQTKAGRLGLRMLHDIGRVDAADVLVERFAMDERPDEPAPLWVAEHLDAPQRLEWVRRGALAGRMRPLAALLEAGIPERDEQIRELCVSATRRFLSSDIGMTPDGTGMWGLLALDLNGRIAAATRDDELRREAAERLLVYATDSRWPMVNRISALRGLYALAPREGQQLWLDQLRVLARPDHDLDEDAYEHIWAERGELEAIALTVCAIVGRRPPGLA